MMLDGDRQYRVDIDGQSYGMEHIESGEIKQSLFDDTEDQRVGNTVCASLKMVLWDVPEPSRMGEIRLYIRDVGESEWTPLGTFWIDQRSVNGSRMELTAYDVMMSAEIEWLPGQSERFPMSMERAAGLIAESMGTSLDARCGFRPYTVDYPAEGYTMRQVLGYIAGAHGGNWIVTAEGQLLLVPLYDSMPPETHYLVTGEGCAITFGGVRILV